MIIINLISKKYIYIHIYIYIYILDLISSNSSGYISLISCIPDTPRSNIDSLIYSAVESASKGALDLHLITLFRECLMKLAV